MTVGRPEQSVASLLAEGGGTMSKVECPRCGDINAIQVNYSPTLNLRVIDCALCGRMRRSAVDKADAVRRRRRDLRSRARCGPYDARLVEAVDNALRHGYSDAEIASIVGDDTLAGIKALISDDEPGSEP